jgi:hypothetical protein
MEPSVSIIEPLFKRIEAYSETSLKLTKLRILDGAITVGTALITKLSVVLMFTLFIIMAGVAIAQFLGDILGKSYYGFFIVAAFYLVAGIILHFFMEHWIKKPISDLIVSASLKEEIL